MSTREDSFNNSDGDEHLFGSNPDDTAKTIDRLRSQVELYAAKLAETRNRAEQAEADLEEWKALAQTLYQQQMKQSWSLLQIFNRNRTFKRPSSFHRLTNRR